VDEDNMFLWEVGLFGPPDTIYAGGYFKVFFFDDFSVSEISVSD
jgi:ubiquitin-protein ligase